MEDKCGIYKITNQINNKSYIGKSKHIYLRWKQHHTEPFNPNSDAYNTLFYRAIRKYGLEQFQFEVIEECDECELNDREKYWIKYYNTFILSLNSNGYNMTEGGEFTSFQLQYNIDLIKKLWNEGKTHQEIQQITNYDSHILTRYLDYLQIDINERRRRANLYKAKTVYKYSLNGKYIQSYSSVSEAVRSLLSEYPKANTSNICYACNGKIKSAYGYIWSYKLQDQSIKKIKHTKVNQYDLSGKYIQTFDTQSAACQAAGIKNISSITQACQGKNKTAGGFIWRYYDALLENPTEDLSIENIIPNNKQSNTTKRKETRKRYKVDQYDLKGNYINTYSNMAIAANAVGLKCKNNIWKACNGEQKTAGGYIWKYNKEHMEVQ